MCVHRIVSASISVNKVDSKDTMKMPIDIVVLFLLLTLNRYMLTGVFMTFSTLLFANTEQKIFEFCFKNFFNKHCVKSVHIQSFSGRYSVRMWKNTDQKNSEYGHLSRSEIVGNKAKGRISKRVFQESRARQNFRKTNISYPLIRTREM